tara:strand:- start:21675 stop:22133 length:459 start_codon:yes stop_codon:yes gene_type:complete
MLIDKSLEMADAVDISASAGGPTKVGTGIDLRPVGVTDNATLDMSVGENLQFVVDFTTAVLSGGSATVNVHLTTADNEALTSNPVDIFTTGAQAKADLIVGKRFRVALPKADYKRFLGVRITTGTATTTAGAINAFLVKDVNAWTSTDTRTD